MAVSQRQQQAQGAGRVLAAIHVPSTPAGHHGAYGELRDRGSIDFPSSAWPCASTWMRRPRVRRPGGHRAGGPATRIKGTEALVGLTPGTEAFQTALEELAESARRQCRPMDNIPGDAAWRARWCAPSRAVPCSPPSTARGPVTG
ncbi:MAG: hypothetical protein R3E96_06250 [Planctomycetota bacterium]